ncbi:MAG: gliding motility-associated C-terminal domain-containing protein [Bacteroidaceae bacterium]|nr:gliding motility-associated C-terminal domain-containing protein [Bacteroidaceae bacterium]
MSNIKKARYRTSICRRNFISMKTDSRWGMLFFLLLFPLFTYAQTCAPTATYVLGNGEETDDASAGVSAPIQASFAANPSDIDGWDARYEWKIYAAEDTTDVLVHRFEENLEYTFTRSGSFIVRLMATFSKDGNQITYDTKEEDTGFSVVIPESKLEMPNAFSPNGDAHNDIYKAKSNHQSIVEFRAIIFNRWGHKLYEWTDINGGWDGTYKGKRVKDGVYFVNVSARGADGHVYNIRKDVNVLTGIKEDTTSGTGTP